MIVYFHRNNRLGYSINKVTQTLIRNIANKKEFYVPENKASFVSIIKNILFVLRHRDKNCINHITGDIHYCMLGLIGCKSILTIHDTVLLDYNEGSKIKKIIAEWLWFRLPLKIATKVVCISESTKKKVSQYTNRKDIEVIYDSIEDKEVWYRDYQMHECPNILIIGTKKNKNIERTFLALKGLPVHIVIIGKLSNEQIKILEDNNLDFENKFDLTDEEIEKAYQQADILSFISLFEGFGMPIIEANQNGLPIICSNIPVLKEVAGESALFVDPYNIQDIHDSFIKMIDNIELRKQLSICGYENIKRFNVTNNLSKLIALYESIEI